MFSLVKLRTLTNKQLLNIGESSRHEATLKWQRTKYLRRKVEVNVNNGKKIKNGK